MKIIQLTAENVKRLKVVDITAVSGLNQITGKNGHGKTSVLDSIWWALGGKEGIQGVPIRKGAEAGRIRLNLGDIIVERKFLASGTTTLTVRNATGAEPGTPDKKLPTYGSPQEILDALVGRLSFDPLEFAKKKPRDQFEELRAISKLAVDIESLEAQNDADFKKRTDLNRDAKAKHAQADGIVFPANTPEVTIDESEILDSIQSAGDYNAAIETRKGRRQQAQRDANEKKAEGVRLREKSAAWRADMAARVAELRSRADKMEAEAEETATKLDSEATTALNAAGDLERKIDSAESLPTPIDVSQIREKLNEAKAINANIAKREQRKAIEAEAAMIEASAAALTASMARRAAEKLRAIKEAEMPVEGLGFGEGFVTFNGLPFEQASDAERLRVSIAIAMAANPKLRVIRIRDGSLLDDDGIATISKMAVDQDYQIWMERVDGSGKIGIVMEDGEVAVNNQVAE